MKNKNTLLHSLVKVIGEECLRQAEAGGNIGDQDYHIEDIRRIENDGPAWNFEVTSWTEQSEDPVGVNKMSFVEVIEAIARAVGFSALEAAYVEVKKHEVKQGGADEELRV